MISVLVFLVCIIVPRNISCLTENPEDDEEILPELELEKPKFGKVTKKKKPEHMYHMQTLKGMHHYGALVNLGIVCSLRIV